MPTPVFILTIDGQISGDETEYWAVFDEPSWAWAMRPAQEDQTPPNSMLDAFLTEGGYDRAEMAAHYADGGTGGQPRVRLRTALRDACTGSRSGSFYDDKLHIVKYSGERIGSTAAQLHQWLLANDASIQGEASTLFY